MYNPFGIDISAWEKDIFWDRLSPRPALVIAKASEYKWPDRLFTTHAANMKAFGAPMSAYHFFHADDVPAQVNTYLEQCRKGGLFADGKWTAQIPPILDAEYAPPKPPRKKPKGYKAPPQGAALAAQYKAWLDGVEAATGVKPIIYTSQNYWSYTLDWLGRPPAWTRDYQLWLAYYPDRPQDFSGPTAGMLPKGWLLDDVIMWQYDEAGRLEGIPYDGVDLNWIKKSWLESIAPTEPPEPVESFQVTVEDGESLLIYDAAGVTVKLLDGTEVKHGTP